MSAAPIGFTLRFRFAVNASGKDKNWDFELLATRYRDTEGTIEDVKRHVAQGHALCAGLLRGKRRSKANVIGSQWLLLDIDNSSVQKDESGQSVKGEDGKPIKVYDPHLTLDAALAHPFIQQYCALIYTTASHRPDWHKFRLVFLLPEYVEGADAVEACTRFLMQHLPHDPACKDASRVFYGNSKAEFSLVQPNATLPLDWVTQARAIAQKERSEHAEQARRFEERRSQLRERAEVEGWDTDALIQQALSYIPPRSLGSGNYQECLQVLMALYAHYGPEAEAVAESWSPSIKGTTWNIDRKIRSFRGGRINGISIGTLFHIAKQYGFKFPSPERQQRWDEPDAQAYDKYLKQEAEQEHWEEYCDRHIELQQEDSFKSFFTNHLARLQKLVTGKAKGFTYAKQINKKVFGEKSTPESQTRENSNNARNKDTLRRRSQRSDIKRFARALALRCSPKFRIKKSRSFWSSKTDVVEFEPSEHLATIQKLAQQAATDNKPMIVLDVSEGGAGKSYLAGELTPEGLGVNTVFYISQNHRNPSVASIEQNYTDLPVRHDGLVSDNTQLTPLGNPYLRWSKPGEEPNVEGNCAKAHLFHIFSEKGYKETQSEAASNPICATCRWKSNCAGVDKLPTIPRHTFRQQRRDALVSDRIRCALDSLPDISKMQSAPKDEEEKPKRVAVIVDEFPQFRGHNQTQTTLSDFDNAWMHFKSQIHNAEKTIKQLKERKKDHQTQINAKMAQSEKLEGHLALLMTAHQQLDLGFLPNNKDDKSEKIKQLEFEIAQIDSEVAALIKEIVAISDQIVDVEKNTEELPAAIAALEPIIFALRSILNGEHETTSETRYGWDEATIRVILGELDLGSLKQPLAILRAFTPKLAALLREADSVTLDGMSAEDRKGSAAALKAARQAMQKEADKENREAIANMPSNCIVPLLEILLGEKRGSFRINFKELTIFTRDDRHRNQLKQADFTLILDGTKTRESLAQDLDVDPSEIVVICQKRKRHANLKIVQVAGMGLLGRDRSESMKQRVKALTGAILERHGEENVGVLDHAACVGSSAEEAESGYWFHDNRGSNAFQNKNALLTFGTPFTNIGQLQMEYTTLTGDRNPDKDNLQFAAFVQDRVQSEVAQSGWRLRSSRREGDQLVWYIVSDQDLSYLREYFPESELEVRSAFQLTPEAASVGEQTYWTILQASKQLIETGQKLTTGAIAQIVGCHRSRISQIAKDVVGGFPAFQRVLGFLLRSLYRRTNTPPGDGETLSEDELFAAKTYLPLALGENASTPEEGIKEVLSTAQSLGEESFRRVLTSLRWEDRAQMLAHMIAILPDELKEDFLELGKLVEDQAIAS